MPDDTDLERFWDRLRPRETPTAPEDPTAVRTYEGVNELLRAGMASVQEQMNYIKTQPQGVPLRMMPKEMLHLYMTLYRMSEYALQLRELLATLDPESRDRI
jgi:hypothetical protein